LDEHRNHKMNKQTVPPGMTETADVTFDGKPIRARRGESLAAALTANEVRVFRKTRLDADRGLFCGMGVCQDCLVEVNGEAGRRACMTKIDGAMTIRSGQYLRQPAPVSPEAKLANEVLKPDVLVIGAGPGGLAAAAAARRAGATVLLVDERSGPGGQYYKQIAVESAGTPPPDGQHLEGGKLINLVRRLGVDLRQGVTVWGAFQPNTYAGVGPAGAMTVLPKAAVIATGAYERGWPVPGWTLPGVMTTGAAQTLWRTARRLPGQRVLIAGNGPLNLQVAVELMRGGADMVALAEAADQPGVRDAAAMLRLASSGPASLAMGLSYHLWRLAAGAPMLFGTVLSRVEETPSGLKAHLTGASAARRDREIMADVICLGYGFEPANELLRAMGAAHNFDAERGHLATSCDADGRTSLRGVFAVGDCTGLGGAWIAGAAGTIAGSAAARDACYAIPAALEADVARARLTVSRQGRFQRALWSVFSAPGYNFRLATPETIICRCEEVTFGEIETALSEGLSLIGAVKRRTRAGMGRCQGRYCGPVLQQLLSERCQRPRNEFSGFAPRIPVKPVAIRDLAQFQEP
jgi:thioredoxin reductase